MNNGQFLSLCFLSLQFQLFFLWLSKLANGQRDKKWALLPLRNFKLSLFLKAKLGKTTNGPPFPKFFVMHPI
jgi:hypothetical protein